jgi:hypothetical protein
MSEREQHKRRLFASHLQNLQSVCPKASGVFVCPICFDIFTKEDLLNGLVDTGHVWNRKFVRKYTSGKKARHQQVLLCQRCNSRSGGRGENILIEFEDFRRTQKAGRFYKPRTRVFPPTSLNKPADLGSTRVEVRGTSKEAALCFPVNERTGLPLYNPKEQQKFDQYTAQGPCTVLSEETYPFREKWLPAQAVLLTSAYLLAFYSFGYRYIFHTHLDPVREYILSSFEGDLDDRLSFDEAKSMSVSVCSQCFNTEPEIDFLLSDGKSPHCLEISLLDYHTRLPYTPCPSLLEETLALRKGVRAISRASEHVAHGGICSLVSLIGEPDYRVEGDKLVQCAG